MTHRIHWERAEVFHSGSSPIRVMLSRPRMKHQILHDHEFIEFGFVISGTGIHLTGEEAVPLLPGDVFGIPAGMAHGFSSDDNLALYNLMFEAEHLGVEWDGVCQLPGLRVLLRERKILHLGTEEFCRCRLRLEEIREEERAAPPGALFLRRALLVELLVRLGRLPVTEGPESAEAGNRENIGRVLEFLHNNYAAPLRLPQLVRLSRMSRTAFCVNFHRQTGLPPMEYLLRLRLERVKVMLKNDDCSIESVAFKNGFTDSSYLARQFKSLESVTPRQFREQFRSKHMDEDF